MTNQKNSGRCWIFAALNVIRLPFIKYYNVEDFEFSQGYLFFWDKIERCNYFLNNIVEVTRRNEAVDDRLMSFLLHVSAPTVPEIIYSLSTFQDPTSDGGQWDMIVNLINKHGLIPKKCFPETFSCESSTRMNQILKSKVSLYFRCRYVCCNDYFQLREYAKAIRETLLNGGSDVDIQNIIEVQMSNIYRIVGICLGIPSDTFTWNYYDKTKAYHSIGPITPKEFYESHVKVLYNVDEKVN